MIKPYYEEPNITIYNSDCLEIMKELPDKSIDLVLTDPPFFMPAIHYQSRISWGRCWGDLSILGEFFYNLTKEYKRIIKNSGHLMVFCNDESYPVFYPIAYGLWDFTRALVWDKTRVGLGKIFRHQYELILWASNRGARVNNDGKLHSNILKYAPTLSKDREHPVEKPINLLVELMGVVTDKNNIVLDSFIGGGSTIEACKKTNRKCIGIEISQKYCDIAIKRLGQEVFNFE